MSARDVIAKELHGLTKGEIEQKTADAILTALRSMPTPARIAFTLELLVGTERVVVRDIPEEIVGLPHPCDYGRGWNACRAAMMENGDE